MNDCFWSYLCDMCVGDHCRNCNKYVSITSDTGEKMLKEYQAEVDERLRPLTEKWREKMNGYSVN